VTKIISSKHLFFSTEYKEPVVTYSAGDIRTAATQRKARWTPP